MRVFLTLIVAIVLVASVGANAADKSPSLVTMQGTIVCLACNTLAATSTQPGICMAGLAATDGTVYSLVPNAAGRELEAMATRSPKVEIQGYVLPNTRIVEIYSYSPITKFRPLSTGLYNPWFNY